MKHKLLAVILILLFAVYPIYAGSPFTVSLNGLTYTPKNSIFELKGTLYISADDFSALTNSQLTPEGKNHILTLRENTVKLTANDRITSINGKTQILVNMPLLIKGQIYLPVNILDYLKYPYTFDKASSRLVFNDLPPYSRIRDDYKDHQLMNTKIDNLSETFKSLMPEDQVSSLLQKIGKTDHYLSFIDNTDKITLLNHMRSQLLGSKEMQVVMREVDLLSTTPQIYGFTTLPLKATAGDSDFTLKIGNTTIPYNCIWAAYKPSDSALNMDVTKSLDATLMRVLYEYYRDKHDLKDDVHFSPIVTVYTNHPDYVAYTVYSDHLPNQHNIFDIKIFKVIEQNKINYFIDFTARQ